MSLVQIELILPLCAPVLMTISRATVITNTRSIPSWNNLLTLGKYHIHINSNTRAHGRSYLRTSPPRTSSLCCSQTAPCKNIPKMVFRTHDGINAAATIAEQTTLPSPRSVNFKDQHTKDAKSRFDQGFLLRGSTYIELWGR